MEMLTFAFICLCFALLGLSIGLGYLHLQRENKRQWRAYSRRAFKQVQSLRSEIRGELVVQAGNIQLLSLAKKETSAGLRAVNPRVKSEDRHEKALEEVVVIGDQTVRLPKLAS